MGGVYLFPSRAGTNTAAHLPESLSSSTPGRPCAAKGLESYLVGAGRNYLLSIYMLTFGFSLSRLLVVNCILGRRRRIPSLILRAGPVLLQELWRGRGC